METDPVTADLKFAERFNALKLDGVAKALAPVNRIVMGEPVIEPAVLGQRKQESESRTNYAMH